MKRCLAARLLALPLWIASAAAAEPVSPPAMYPPESWEGRSAAIVRVLDKLDAHVETLSIPVGQSGSYKSLGIAIRRCLQHPPGLPPDAAAALSVRDANAAATPFEGWMFSAEPFVAVFESPVYGVQLVSCGGGEAAPAAPALPPAVAAAPADADRAAPPPDAPPPDAEPSPVYPSGEPPPPAAAPPD